MAKDNWQQRFLPAKPVKPSGDSYSIFPLTNCLKASLSRPASETAHAIHKLRSRNFYKETERKSPLAPR